MPTTLDSRRQIADAVAYARKGVHQPGCQCFSYVDASGERFCTAQEALWHRAINTLIDQCRG